MGVLRILLATAVVLQHIGSLAGLTMTGSVVSVETFYIISGFYMALILSEKYTGARSYPLFVTNRFLRIFPIYWLILAATIVVCLASWVVRGDALLLHAYIANNGQVSSLGLGYVILTNLIVLGQDTIMFLTTDATGTLAFTSNFWSTQPQLFNFLLVPQAWTLALELTFYLIAPILNRQNTPVLVSIAAASLGVRLVTYFVLGFHHDPWTYRFFPSELMFFVSGMLSFRIYSHSSPGLDLRWSRLVWFSLIAATVVFQYLPGGSIKLMAYFILVFLGLPFVFRATRKSVIDRQLGEMSYPIYLSHLVVFAFFNSFPMFARNNLLLQITSLSTTIFVSFLLVRFVSRSLEGFRQRRATARWEGINSPMFAKSKYSVS